MQAAIHYEGGELMAKTNYLQETLWILETYFERLTLEIHHIRRAMEADYKLESKTPKPQDVKD